MSVSDASLVSPLTWSNVNVSSIQPPPHGSNLISIEKGKLSIGKEGGDYLKSQKKPVNLIFIFGNARSGKSFLLNCLVGFRGLFKVMNSATPCTKGVDISSYFIKHEQIVQHVNTFKSLPSFPSSLSPLSPLTSSCDSPFLGFVDVEGQGAEDNNHDTMMALPLLLTSKVVLFNHKGAPTVQDMLSKLGVLARAADYIDLGDEEDKDGSKGNSSSSSHRFGHLHVVFRDFSFDSNKESVYNQLMGMETVAKIKKSKNILSANNSNNNGDAEEQSNRSIQERNDIRQLLKDNFESIHIHLFKQPASADLLKAHKELPPSLIDPEFIETVKELLYLIAQQTGTPHMFQRSTMTGPKLLSLLHQIAQCLNEKGSIDVPSVFRAMEGETINKVYADCVSSFNHPLQLIKTSKLPTSTQKITTELNQLKRGTMDKFEGDLSNCLLEKERENKLKDLIIYCDKEISSVLKENETQIINVTDRIVHKEFLEFKEQFDLYCNKNIPLAESKLLETTFNELKGKCLAAIQKELNGTFSLGEVLNSQRYMLLILKNEESLHECLTYKMIENESTIKERTIKQLQSDLIDQQHRLIEQNKRLEMYVVEEKNNSIALQAELEKLKKAHRDEEERLQQSMAQLEKQKKELEELRKKQKKCTIL